MTFARRQSICGATCWCCPAVVLLIGLVAYPFFYAIYISFTSRIVGDPGEWIGLDNFRYLSKTASFEKTIRNTITLVVVSDIAKLVIGLGLALVLNEQIRGRGAFRAVMLLPWAMPGFVAFLVWRLLFMPIGGGINLILTETGIHTRDRRLARPEVDGDAGGDHRHRLARISVLVHFVSGCVANRSAGPV